MGRQYTAVKVHEAASMLTRYGQTVTEFTIQHLESSF